MLSFAAALMIAQAATAAPLPALEQDRLALCAAEARTDPATAMLTASEWLEEAQGAARSAPQQCLGVAFVSLLRWDAAEAAFLAAREALPATRSLNRVRLAAMAGNAALAGGRAEAALAAFVTAQGDAAGAGDSVLSGVVAADRARALVALDRTAEASLALAEARRDAPQEAGVWLLSATLSRRMDRLEEAGGQIRTAAALAENDPVMLAPVGLEAGLIAVLSGQDEAARSSWQAVLAAAPDSPEASAARQYLGQLDQVPAR